MFFSLYEPRFGHRHTGSWRDELNPPPALHPAVLWGGQGHDGAREDQSGLGVGCRDKKRKFEFKFAIVNSQMTKKIKKLEKETIIWRTKWENNNKALLQMAEEVRWFPVTRV